MEETPRSSRLPPHLHPATYPGSNRKQFVESLSFLRAAFPIRDRAELAPNTLSLVWLA